MDKTVEYEVEFADHELKCPLCSTRLRVTATVDVVAGTMRRGGTDSMIPIVNVHLTTKNKKLHIHHTCAIPEPPKR
jgi:hypothetical protein